LLVDDKSSSYLGGEAMTAVLKLFWSVWLLDLLKKPAAALMEHQPCQVSVLASSTPDSRAIL
jgi:hypothetical protein